MLGFNGSLIVLNILDDSLMSSLLAPLCSLLCSISEWRKEAISMVTIGRRGCGDRDIESLVLWVDHRKHNC